MNYLAPSHHSSCVAVAELNETTRRTGYFDLLT